MFRCPMRHFTASCAAIMFVAAMQRITLHSYNYSTSAGLFIPLPCLPFPCATQNEIDGADAAALIKNGCMLVAEGANMPTDLDGINAYLQAKILYGPAKAANAGGVATSGLEMSQNSMRLKWTAEEVDAKLHSIMSDIHENAYSHAREYSPDSAGDFTNYVAGANIAGFVKVADAMIDQGLV